MVGMRDVAKRAGVSVSSVSLVINGTGYVSRDMREKVEQAMRELDYVPNELARNFYHGKTGIIGVIVPTIQHPFFATLTAHLQHEFADRGLQTMLCSTADSANGEAQYVDMLRRHSLDALVVAAHTTHDPQYWRAIDRPVVAFDRNLGAGITQVSSDHVHGGELIAELLVRTGAHPVVMVGGPRAQFTDLGDHSTFPTVRYVQTLEDRLSQARIAHTYIESGEVFDIAGVRRAVREAFDTYPDMDAFVGADLAAAFAVQEAVSRSIAVPGDVQIVAYDGTLAADCAGNLAAAFAVQEAVSRSIAVPGDVQIVAYDGTLAADCAGMPLTTVAQDFGQIAHTIAACVEHGIESSPQRPDATDGDANMTISPVTLHERATTRR